MQDKKVKISNILGSLIPDFIQSESPDFEEFLKQYYISQEHNYGTIDIAENIADYKSISGLSEVETLRAQTIAPPETPTPPQVVVVTQDVFAYDDTIYVNHTTGFPSSYGLIKIDNEIITYTGKTTTSFTGCVRGFSGISEIESAGNPEFLTFSNTEAAEHSETSVVLNLNFIFLGKLYNKFKAHFLPGVENRQFAPGLSVENILTRAKDFYTTKGTDISLDILFKVLYGKEVSIVKPFDYTLSTSDADWVRADEVMVEAISGDPLNLKFSTLYQGNSTDFATNFTAFGAISNVEEVFLGTKRYHKILLSKEVGNKKFNINNKTKVTTVASGNNPSIVTVDSTIGFGNTGFFYFKDVSGTYTKAEFKSKSVNQFFECVGVTTSLKENDSIIGDNFVFGYEDNDNTRVCQMRVLGSVSGFSKGFENTKFFNAGDEVGVKHLGVKKKNNQRFNSWIHNNVSYVDISSVVQNTITTKGPHYLGINDTIDIREKISGKLLNSRLSVDTVQSPTKFSVTTTPGTIQSNIEYRIKKNLNYVDSRLGLDSLLCDIQNSYSDIDNNTYIAFSGYPSGGIASTDRSQVFTSSGINTSGIGISISNHGFLNGEKIFYEPLYTIYGTGTATTITSSTLGYVDSNGKVLTTGQIGIDTGIYYVKKVDDNTIKLSLSESSVYNDNTLWNSDSTYYPIHDPVGIASGIEDLHKITPYVLYEANKLTNQNNFKRIFETPKAARTNKEIIGPIGVGVNGVELYSPISEDSYYYGQLDDISVIDFGDGYDVVNPPLVAIADTAGNSAEGIVHLSDGHINEVVVTDSGWDYGQVPSVTITGGNGRDTDCEAKMKAVDYMVTFPEQSVGIGGTIGQIEFTTKHRFIDGEEVIYTTTGTPIGVGKTYANLGGLNQAGVGATTVLQNGARYYISKVSETKINLAITPKRAIDKKYLIDFTSDGAGAHTLTATRKRSIVDRVVVRNPGQSYANNKVSVTSLVYPPAQAEDISTTFVGINTHDDYIYAKNHNFSSGEIVTYSTTGTAIGGLSTLSQYKVKVIDKDKFKLSDSGTAKNLAPSFEFRRTERLTSHTYVSGATSWQQVDNASTNNGYVGIWLRNLRPGSKYRISLRVDNNAALDGGSYDHRVHPLNNNPARTNFTDWNGSSAGLLTAEFIATTENDDEFLFYANAITVNISDFEVKLVSAVDDYERNVYVNLNSIGIGTHTFNYPEVKVTIEGVSAVGIESTTRANVSYYTAKGYAEVKGKVDNIFLTKGGVSYGSSEVLNYVREPSIKLETGENGAAGCVVDVNGRVVSAYVILPGAEYSTPPVIEVVGSGRYAKLRANVSGGKLTSIDVVKSGNGYTQGQTSLKVIPAGKGSSLMANIHRWKINNVERYDNQLKLNGNVPNDYKETVTLSSNVRKLGNKIAAFYATKQLRYDLGDNLKSNYEEIVPSQNQSLEHSPIIGWAYDGNPIYGPYSTKGGGIGKLVSGYGVYTSPLNQNLRPNKGNGYFVEDYHYNANNGDLDQYNGRFSITPEYPNGTYAYFSSLDAKPTFPYITFQHRNETDKFNYDLEIDQSDTYVNSGEYRRNVTHLGLNEPHNEYPFLLDQLKSNTNLNITLTKNAGITTIQPQHPGYNYKVGEIVSFGDNSNSKGVIKEILGKNIISVGTSEMPENNLTFSVVDNNVTAFSTLPHSYKTGDFVQISGISSALYDYIEGNHVVGVPTSPVTAVSVAIANTATTGMTTFISLTETTHSMKFGPDDVISIEDEQLLILDVDKVNNRYRVARKYNNSTAGVHDVTRIVRKLPKTFTFSTNRRTKNKIAKVPKKAYFDGSMSVGIGTSSTGYIDTIVGTAGSTTLRRSIPERGIYLPNHDFVTGDTVNYLGVGSTIGFTTIRSAFVTGQATSPKFDLINYSPLYVVKLSNEYIGLSTALPGTGAAAKVGFTTNYVWFTEDTGGRDHRIEEIVDNVTGSAARIIATVELDESHSMKIDDNINLSLSPSRVEKYTFKYNDYNKKLVANPVGLTTNNVGVGIGSTSSQITIVDHRLNTGDIVVYTSTDPISPLVNDGVYHVIRISNNTIKLAKNAFNAGKIPYENIVFTNSGTGISSESTLSLINPPLSFRRGNTVAIGVSDPSLANYKIEFYYDNEFKSKANVSTNDIALSGSYGDSSPSTQLTVSVGSSFPSSLYYRVEGHGINYTNTYPSSTNTDVPDHSHITIVDSTLNGSHNIVSVGTSSFKVNLVGFAETTLYNTSGFTSAFYSTSSKTEMGGIHSVDITESGDNESLPKVISIGTTTGSESVFLEDAIEIGQVLNSKLINQGLEFSADKTLTPKADVYTILKLKDVYTLKSIGVTTGGRSYTSAPKVVAIGNTSIVTKSTLTGNSVSDVEIIVNDTGLSKDIKFIPQNNSNGVGITSAICDPLIKVNTLSLQAPANVGFATGKFPFEVGDSVWIENVKLVPGSGDGYNSSDYDYTSFTVTGINTISGAESVSYSIAGLGVTGGVMDTSNIFGRIVKTEDLASFSPELGKVIFTEGEKISEIGGDGIGYVAKDGWNKDAQTLKLKKVTGTFTNDSKIKGDINSSKSILQNTYDFDFDLDVNSIVEKEQTWTTEKGKLNLDSQRIHDNDYYQRFSYSIQGEVPYETWKESVSSLGHISGYKAFSNYEMISRPPAVNAGMSTTPVDITFNVELNSDVSLYDRWYYDLASEITQSREFSKIITFDSKVLTDYAESKTNKVLLIDDISGQFTGQNRTFTGAHQFVGIGTTAINRVSGGSGTLDVIDGTTYDPSTGILSVTVATARYTPSNATYDAATGNLVLSLPGGHGLTTSDKIKIKQGSIGFTCKMDGDVSKKYYPRPGIDTTAHNNFLDITNVSGANEVTVNVGTSATVNHNVTDGTFNPNTGEMTLTIGAHSLKKDTNVRFARESLIFQCAKDNYASDKGYPRPAGTGIGSATATAVRAGFGTLSSTVTDVTPVYGGFAYVNTPEVVVQPPPVRNGIITACGFWQGGFGFAVGDEFPLTHRYSSGVGTEARIRVTSVGNNGMFQSAEITYGGYGYQENSWVRFKKRVYLPGPGWTWSVINGLINIGGIANNVSVGVGIGTTATAVANVTAGVVTSYTITNPGLGYTEAPIVSVADTTTSVDDPAYNKPVTIKSVTPTTITVGIGTNSISDKSTHRWKPSHTATNAVHSGGNYDHTFVSGPENTDAVITEHDVANGHTISLRDNSMTFRCDQDNYSTDHTYPRTSDPASTANSRLNNGILTVSNASGNTFNVTINNPVVGGTNVGISTFTLYTVDQAGSLPVGVSTERLFYKTINPATGINTVTGFFTINDHEFNKGEMLIYSTNGGTAISIDNGSGGSKAMPSVVYAINGTDPRDRNKFQIAETAALASAGTAVTVTNAIGIGNNHTFSVETESATNRVMISIDNIIQSPISYNKGIVVGLSSAIGIGSTQIKVNNPEEMQGNTLLKVQDEIMRVNLVGIGSTNRLNVERGIMGTSPAAHVVGAAVTVLSGDFRIQDGIIHFKSPPYGPVGIGSLKTKSTFNGRSFYRLDYSNNVIFDDISEDFDGATTNFDLKRNGVAVSGIQTNYGFVLVNNIFQDIHVGDGGSSWKYSDYRIESPGNEIEFQGTAGGQTAGTNTLALPKGGIINEFSVNPGVGIQSSFTALGQAVVSAAGTIGSIGITTGGSGYLTPPRVSIAITNYQYAHRFVSAANNSITVTNGGATHTPSYAVYEPTTGLLTLTITGHGLSAGIGNSVSIANNSLVFQCSKDNYTSNHPYPRTTDPVSGISTDIISIDTNSIVVNVGTGAGVGASCIANLTNGVVTSIDVVNPGSGYNTTFQPAVIIDPPSPWTNIPLTGGTGSDATMDVVIGAGGSAITYSLNNAGRAYSVGDVLKLDPVPYQPSIGAGNTSPFTITVKNRHQDKFSGYTVGQLFELDDISSLFNGYRKTFLITRTIVEKKFYSIIAQKDSGIVLANNLLIFINDVLQQPVKDYEFTSGTRLKFNEAPKAGSKFRMYLYVASTDDFINVKVTPTIKPGDGLTLQVGVDTTTSPETLVSAQDERIVYQLIASDSVETQTYAGIGIRTDGLERPIMWSKQTSDTIIDGVEIPKSRVPWSPQITPNTNIVASVASTDTSIHVRNIYPTFDKFDDLGQNLNDIRIVGIGTTVVEENIKKVSYSGDYGQIVAIGHTNISTTSGLTTAKPALIFDINTDTDIQGISGYGRPGIETGGYLCIENTTIGSGVTALGFSTSTVVGIGTTFIDSVYYVNHYESPDSPGVSMGSSTIRVYCNVDQLTGIDTTTLPAPTAPAAGCNGGGYGTYSWGTISVSRTPESKAFAFNPYGGRVGIESSAYVARILGLKSSLSP